MAKNGPKAKAKALPKAIARIYSMRVDEANDREANALRFTVFIGELKAVEFLQDSKGMSDQECQRWFSWAFYNAMNQVRDSKYPY
jgi:hypothetical protein